MAKQQTGKGKNSSTTRKKVNFSKGKASKRSGAASTKGARTGGRPKK